MSSWNLIEVLKDGTVKHRNPFSGTEAWLTPGRRHRPLHTALEKRPNPLVKKEKQDYCAFCPANYYYTTPEKARFTKDGSNWKLAMRLTPSAVFAQPATIRRIGNLYEIISYEYWRDNYGLVLAKEEKEHQLSYLHEAQGRDHLLSLLRQKQGKSHTHALNQKEMERATESFFGGSHELIIPARHYIDGATDTSQLCSTGDLTPEEHFHYYLLSIDAAVEIHQFNPHVRFVCIYTNWLRDAGASFEHLHRQIIGVDRESDEVLRGAELAREQGNVFESYVNYLAREESLFICGNQHAVAVVDIGRPFPTIAVFSKSEALRPMEQMAEQVRGMSDVVHAIHAALGRHEAVNEEWYYSPPRSSHLLPWYVLIKWRNHRLAGIEGIAKIYPNEYGPRDVQHMLQSRLYELRQQRKIAPLQIGDEAAGNTIELGYHHAVRQQENCLDSCGN